MFQFPIFSSILWPSTTNQAVHAWSNLLHSDPLNHLIIQSSGWTQFYIFFNLINERVKFGLGHICCLQTWLMKRVKFGLDHICYLQVREPNLTQWRLPPCKTLSANYCFSYCASHGIAPLKWSDGSSGPISFEYTPYSISLQLLSNTCFPPTPTHSSLHLL